MPSKNDADRVAAHTNGFAVRDMRIARYYSIVDFAQALSDATGRPINPNTISNIEAGRRDASPELEAAMAHVLRCKVTTLVRCPGCVVCAQRGNRCPVCERQARESVAREVAA